VRKDLPYRLRGGTEEDTSRGGLRFSSGTVGFEWHLIYLVGVTAEVVDAPRLLWTVMFWGFVWLKNDPVY
jgi:hypothetical protein